jgi:hypothetical protein
MLATYFGARCLLVVPISTKFDQAYVVEQAAVTTANGAWSVLKESLQWRTTRETGLNAASSRSHAVYSIAVEVRVGSLFFSAEALSTCLKALPVIAPREPEGSTPCAL